VNVWRDRLNRWLGPLARRFPLSPNAITVLALLLNAAAAALLVRRSFLLAIVLIAVGGLADALDGAVARAQEKESRFGDFLDHCLDRVADTLVVAGWLIGSGVRQGLVVAAIIAVMMSGYAGTQLEATFRQREYESVGRGEFVLALIVFPIVSHILFANGWERDAFASLTIPEWMTLLLLAFALLGIVQRFRLARRLDRS
jgi:archaetidylinositol phosphate synthase